MRDLSGAYKFCQIDIANCFLKEAKLLKSTVGVGSLFPILMILSVKKTSSDIIRFVMFI